MTIDKNSLTWLEIEKWAKARISQYERRLRVNGVPYDETEGLRYRIGEMEALLNIGNPSKMAAAALKPAKHLVP